MWISDDLQISLTKMKKLPSIIRYGYIESKFGRILLGLTSIKGANDECDAVCLIYFVVNNDSSTLDEVRRRWPSVELQADAVAVEKFSKILCGDQGNNAVINVAVPGTDFQLDVWNALINLKSGRKITYAELAELLERPTAVRAVANAVAKNEVAILIPCHRIISKNGQSKYHWGAELKQELLTYEANTNLI